MGEFAKCCTHNLDEIVVLQRKSFQDLKRQILFTDIHGLSQGTMKTRIKTVNGILMQRIPCLRKIQINFLKLEFYTTHCKSTIMSTKLFSNSISILDNLFKFNILTLVFH